MPTIVFHLRKSSKHSTARGRLITGTTTGSVLFGGCQPPPDKTENIVSGAGADGRPLIADPAIHSLHEPTRNSHVH